MHGSQTAQISRADLVEVRDHHTRRCRVLPLFRVVSGVEAHRGAQRVSFAEMPSCLGLMQTQPEKPHHEEEFCMERRNRTGLGGESLKPGIWVGGLAAPAQET